VTTAGVHCAAFGLAPRRNTARGPLPAALAASLRGMAGADPHVDYRVGCLAPGSHLMIA
jgi:hypothetical protein